MRRNVDLIPVMDNRRYRDGKLQVRGNALRPVRHVRRGKIANSATIHYLLLPVHYLRCRHYESVTGRWMNRAPIEESDGVNLYVGCSNDFVERQDFIGLKCKITIYAGHASSALEKMSNMSKEGKGPSECGDLVGFVSCFRDKINSEADEKFPGHVIPGIPRDRGFLHNDLRPNPDRHELASKGLERAWVAATNAVGSICEKCCCKKVTVSVKCLDSTMREMSRKLYVLCIDKL